MSIQEPPVTIRSALRQLSEDARRQAASVRVDTDDHAFYLGVISAAEDRVHPERLDVHNEIWLERQPIWFREGYLKASALFAASAGHPPFRFHLPTR